MFRAVGCAPLRSGCEWADTRGGSQMRQDTLQCSAAEPASLLGCAGAGQAAPGQLPSPQRPWQSRQRLRACRGARPAGSGQGLRSEPAHGLPSQSSGCRAVVGGGAALPGLCSPARGGWRPALVCALTALSAAFCVTLSAASWGRATWSGSTPLAAEDSCLPSASGSWLRSGAALCACTQQAPLRRRLLGQPAQRLGARASGAAAEGGCAGGWGVMLG